MVRQVTEFDTADNLDYPESDGKPMADNTLQFSWIVLIKEGLEILFATVVDVFVAGDLLWYPVQGDSNINCAPDVMVVFGRPKGHRGSYIQHLEASVAPQVVFEILSPANKRTEMQKKFDFYQTYDVEEYYLYDPKKNNLQGWLRTNKILKPIKNINNWVSPRLKIKFLLTPVTLEIYHPDGEKFSTSVQLSEERKQAKLLAQLEQQQRLLAEQRAQEAEQRAQEAEQRALAERQARINAVSQLLQTGMSVEQVAQILSLTSQEVEQLRNL